MLYVSRELTRIAQLQGGTSHNEENLAMTFDVKNLEVPFGIDFQGSATRSLLGEIALTSNIREDGSMEIRDEVEGGGRFGSFQHSTVYQFMWEGGRVVSSKRQLEGDTGVIPFRSRDYRKPRSNLDLLTYDMQHAIAEMDEVTKTDMVDFCREVGSLSRAFAREH